MTNTDRTNQHPFESNSTVQLSFSRSGTGSATVVLLHGYCGSRRYWDAVVPLLSADYDVIVPDLRGHGESPAPELPVYTMEQLADDTAALLDSLQLDRVYVIGHSLGGYATLAFAERHPDRLLGFGLVHSTSLPDADAGKEARLKTAEQVRASGVRPLVDGLIPKLFAEEHRRQPTIVQQIELAKTIGYGTAEQGAIGCALGMRERPDRTEVLRRTELPVLLLAGAQDEVIPPARRFPVETRPDLMTATLTGTGHMSMMEDPAACSQVLLDFLGKSRGSARV